MTWYFSNIARFKAEREALEQFGLTHDWFAIRQWRFDDRLRLVVDADILAGGKIWPVSLQYPEFFPDTPPSVFPRGDKSRWSFHQYGRGGELCLEYGPDNWTPDLTSVHMIESAHRLLEGENPAPGVEAEVASRHVESLGRQVRLDRVRFVLTRDATKQISALESGAAIAGKLVCCHHHEVVIYVLRSLDLDEGTVWTSAQVPSQLADEYFESTVSVLRLAESEDMPPTTDVASFRLALASHGVSPEHDLVLIARAEELTLFWLFKGGSVYKAATIPVEPEEQRLDMVHNNLQDKKVGLVGCGSVGSKVATMLARAGVAKWLLIDDDLLLVDNLVRHVLDWREIGTHKTESLGRHLQLVNPAVKIEDWKVQIGGQAASASAETILKLLGDCDIIIDATANPDVLNILSAVAVGKAKPIVWAEVFAGGIGGLIARYRPGLEPSPQFMRRAIENWFSDQAASPMRPTRSYATGQFDAVMIADDADVSVIASHAARLVIDLLARPVSIFPNSVYAIGLGVGSVFTEPFDIRPIDVGLPPSTGGEPQLSTDEMQAEVHRLLEIIARSLDDPDTAKKDS